MSMLSVNTFMTDTLSAVDQVIEGFVYTVHQQFLQQYGYALMLLCTVYILVLGYRFTLHTLSADFNTLNRHILILLVVYGLIIN